MIGGKAASQAAPTAMGSLVQASTYGMAIPSVYGTTQCSLLAIWAANIRSGKCNEKKGKSLLSKKKSPPQYVENIDFLIGSNPILGFLQGWSNGSIYPLNFIDLLVPSVYYAAPVYTITDPNFYAVVAITAVITLGGTYNDYGGPGAIPFNVTSEYPLWNAAQQGPDLTDPGYVRQPAYKWAPTDGPNIDFSQVKMAGLGLYNNWPWPFTGWFTNGGDVHIYYAATSPIIKHDTPAAKLCLTFEPSLGDGPEYTTDGDYTAQQIIYPMYAGAGSPDIDLGTSGTIPNLQLEVQGSYGRMAPSGDCDFCDMIEDVIKSGQLQVGAELGLIQRGVNLNTLPAPIQKNWLQYLELSEPAPTFWQPNTAGDILIGFCRFRPGGGIASISSAAGDAWNTIYAGNSQGYFYAISAGTDAPNAVTFQAGGGADYNADAYIFEMDPGSNSIDSVVSNNGVGPGFGSDVMTCSITTSGAPGQPEYILVMCADDSGSLGFNFPNSIPYQWRNILFENALPSWSTVFYRVVNGPGTYTVNITRELAGSAAWSMVMIAFLPSQPSSLPATLGDIVDLPTLNVVRAQCQANGLWGSLNMNSQKTCSDWLKDFYKCADADPVWSGFVLKSIARSEVSLAGNGILFTAPTANGPVATLTESDLIAGDGGVLITVERKAQVDSNNILQVQYFDRTAAYNPSSASEPLSGAIALYGPRKEQPQNLPEIQDPTVARMILSIEVRRYNLLRNVYKFTMKAKWAALEAKDLILINDSQIGISNLPVLLTSIKENDSFELECEAEPFIYGCNAPQQLPVTASAPYIRDPFAIPGPVNVPIIFEPPLAMCLSGSPEIWAVVSDSDPVYGGSLVYVSTDGGVSYSSSPIGTILGNATQGFTVGDWPSTPDPDTTADLDVDLTESNGSLASLNATEQAAFEYPCYVAGGLAPSPTFVAANDWYTGIEPAGFAPAIFPTGGNQGLMAVRTRGDGFAVWFVTPTSNTTGFISSATVGSSGGSGFAVNDYLKVTGGGGTGGILQVATVSGGAITSFNVVQSGYNYVTASNVSLSVLTGSGTGSPTADITAVAGLGPPSTSLLWQPAAAPCCGNTWVTVFEYCDPMGICRGGSYPPPGWNVSGLALTPPPTFLFDYEVQAATFANAGGPIASSAPIPINYSLAWSIELNGATFSPAGGTPSYETFGGAAILIELQPLTAGNPSLFVAITTGTGWSVPPTGWTQLPYTEIGPGGTPAYGITMFTQIGNAGPAAGYELMEYLTATLTAPYMYTLPAGAGGPLRRSCFGVPLTGTGADHPDHSAFAWLNSREVENVPGILKFALQPAWIGTELFFKFVPFNVSGQPSGIGDLADAVPYPYTPTGSASGTGGGGTSGGGSSGGGSGSGSGQTPYTITGGQLTQPNATTIDMADAIATFPGSTANYNARTFTIPAPTVATTYYVTIADPTMMGDVGSSTSLVATAQTSNALVGVQGNIYIGSIVVEPGGGGTTTGGGGFPPPEEILVNGV